MRGSVAQAAEQKQVAIALPNDAESQARGLTELLAELERGESPMALEDAEESQVSAGEQPASAGSDHSKRPRDAASCTTYVIPC